MTPLLKTTGWFVWSKETKGSASAWAFLFRHGNGAWFYLYDADSTLRAFAVRSHPSGEIQQKQKPPINPKNIVNSAPKTKVKVRDGYWENEIWHPPVYK